MAGSRRSPGGRPAGGSGTTRRPTSPGARPGGRSGRVPPRPRVSVDAARDTDEGTAKPPPPKKPPRRPADRPSITGRAALLALVIAVLLVSYAYPLRTWYEQHRERVALEEEMAQLNASVEELEAELRMWDDPAYVQARARERLNFVLPGEQGYVVVPDERDETVPPVDDNGLPPVGDGAWYERLWSSVEAADAEPPEDGQ